MNFESRMPPVRDAARDNAAEHPTQETLLNLLDSELTLLAQQQTNNGWTSWAITGAIGALAWMLLGQWETKWPSGNLWALSYLTLTISGLGLLGLTSVLQSQNPIHGRKTRFQLGYSNFGKQRPLAIYSTVQSIVFLWILFLCPTSPTTRLIVSGWGVAAICLWLFSLSLSYTQFPSQAHVSTGNLSPRVLLLVHLVVTSICLTPAAFLVRDLIRNSPSATDIKVGGLIAAISYLFKHSLENGGHRSLMDNLLRLRRELALGGISAKDAARHVEIEFLGMQVSDIFQKSVQDFMSQVEKLSARCQDCGGRLDAALASLGENSKLAVEQQISLAGSVLESCRPRVQEITEMLSSLNAAYNKIESRRRLFSPSEDAHAAMMGILSNLNRSHREVHASYVAITEKMASIEQQLQVLSQSRAAGC